MRPNRPGQIAKFHTPFPDENPNQLYVLLEVMEDTERPRALIKALGDSSYLCSTSIVLLNDLEIVELQTSELLGQTVDILKVDNTQASGIVVSLNEDKIMLDLNKTEEGVETNVLLNIIDNNRNKQSGTLFVNKQKIS